MSNWITAYTNTFPAIRYKYKHYKITRSGKELEGFVQVRVMRGRVETITCFRDRCVLGSNPDWLARENMV